jgi:hypothetical protein
MAMMKRRGRGYKLTVKKGRKSWTLKTLFKSKASCSRAKKGLAEIGWK